MSCCESLFILPFVCNGTMRGATAWCHVNQILNLRLVHTDSLLGVSVFFTYNIMGIKLLIYDSLSFKNRPNNRKLRLPIGEQSFKIQFDSRIHLGRIKQYETVIVDCEPNFDYRWVLQSQFMLRLSNL